MLSQFIETIHEEMDYSNESSNLKKIKENMKKSQIIVPSFYYNYYSKNFLTME
jgi:predicted unusual protein kinase regulating ubiquinone biosynthesis (AarF/ABC1/UbiB family)